MRRTVVFLAPSVLLLVGCSAATQRAYIAPSSETIVSSTEEREGRPSAHIIFVDNRSTVPVTVFSVNLSGCTNVKQQCGPRPSNLRLAPGQRGVAVRVEPANPQQGFSYHFGFSWHADSSSTLALAALAAGGDPGCARESCRYAA